mgnify:CR=1 FL=1
MYRPLLLPLLPMSDSTVSTSADPWTHSTDALCSMLESLPLPALFLSADATIQMRNDAWEAMLVPELNDAYMESSASSSEVDDVRPGISFLEVLATETETWGTRLHRAQDEATTLRGFNARLHLHGYAPRWVDWTLRPCQTPEGAPNGWAVLLSDRTDAQRAEQMRQDMEQRFDVLLDTIHEGTLLMDRHGTFRDCNTAAARMLGRPASEIIGSRFTDDQWRGLHEDGRPMLNADFPFWQSYVEREPVQGDVMGIYLPNQPPRWLRVSARPLYQANEDDPYAVLACFEDITDEQLKEEALQTSRDLLSSVLSTSLDGILVFSSVRDEEQSLSDFRCELANPQAEKVLGATVDTDLVGTRLSDLPAPETGSLVDAYRHVMETGQPFEEEVRYDTDALSGWFHIVCVRLETGCAVTMRDVSEQKEAAQAMAATNAKLEQRNRALRDFAYVASHDLQEPLRKITAFSNLVLEDYGDAVDDMGHHYLTRMQDAARRMSQLINDLLIYSRITTRAQPFEPVDLNDLVATICADLDMQIDDVNGTVEVGDLPTIEADPTQMRQLFQNLIGNALKFHREDVAPVVQVKGALMSAESMIDAGDVDPAATEGARFTVTDNGIGFEQKYEDRIFTPFKRLHGRSKFSGTGMGLAICRRIVERHGGTIRVESIPDKGTTFTVCLPACRASVGASSTD